MKSSDGKQSHELNVSSGSAALKHILRCLRNMELFHLVGSSKSSQLCDKKTSLRLLSALHDKITARYGSKTAHRVRIVVKADKLVRRERKKHPQDRPPASDDAPASERQDKDVDSGEGRPLSTGEVSALKVPEKGRDMARIPVCPRSSTDKEGCDEDSEGLVSLPQFIRVTPAPLAHPQSDSTAASTRVESPDHLAVQKCTDKRKTFVVSKAMDDSDTKLRRTRFVIPQNSNCVSTSNLNRRTFVVQANESRELLPSPGMSSVAFGELTLLPKDVGETFVIDKSVSNTQECSTGHLALSSSEEESSSNSIKCPQTDNEWSEGGSDAPSTPPSGRQGPGSVNYVPRGRQLYRTSVTGLGKNKVTGKANHTEGCSSQTSEDDLDNQPRKNGNHRAEDSLSSANEFSAESEVDIKRGRKKKEVNSAPKRGRKKKEVNSATEKKQKKTSSAVSKTQAKAEQTGALIATVHSINDREGKTDSKKGTPATPLTRGDEWDKASVNFPRPHRSKKTEHPTNSALCSVLGGNAGSNEVFDELKDQNSRKATEGEKSVINRKVAHTYSKKETGERTNVSNKKVPLVKLTKKHSSYEMIAEPQEPIESNDLTDELPEKRMRRPCRQRGTKVVDYNESPFKTPTLPQSRGRRGRVMKHSHGSREAGAIVSSDTHEPENILDTPQTSSEVMSETGSIDRDNLEYSNVDFHDNTESANEADEIVSHISGRDSVDSDLGVDPKRPTQRGRVRGRDAKNGLSPVMPAAKSNSITRESSRKKKVLVNANKAPNVLETVAPEANLTKRGLKSPTSAPDGRAMDEHKPQALREGAVTHGSKSRGKKIDGTSKTCRERNATASPGECVLEMLAPPLKRGSGASRGRVRTSAKRGKGRGSNPNSSKPGRLEELDDENSNIVEEVSESEPDKENLSEEESLSAKKVVSGRIPACTKLVKKKRGTRNINKVTPRLSSSPGHLEGSQDVNKEHDTTGEILPKKRSRKGKSAISKGSNEPETIAAVEIDDGIKKNCAPVLSIAKTTSRSKVQKPVSAKLESKFVEAETSAVPKRKREVTNWKDQGEIDEESPNKKTREEALNGRSGEALATVAKNVSSRRTNGSQANKTKVTSVKSSRKVNFESLASTSTVTGRGSSKSKVVTKDEPAAVVVSKPRATRARAGRSAAK